MKNKKITIMSIVLIIIIILLILISTNKPIFKSTTINHSWGEQNYGYIIYANGTIKEFNKYAKGRQLKKSKISKEELTELKALIRNLKRNYEPHEEEIHIADAPETSEKVYKTFSIMGIVLFDKKITNEHPNAVKINNFCWDLREKYLGNEK